VQQRERKSSYSNGVSISAYHSADTIGTGNSIIDDEEDHNISTENMNKLAFVNERQTISIPPQRFSVRNDRPEKRGTLYQSNKNKFDEQKELLLKSRQPNFAKLLKDRRDTAESGDHENSYKN
jgi:hypothetical protein